MSTTEDRIKIPSSDRFARLADSLQNDDDFRFPRIKLNRDKPRYEIPAPTSEDRDAIKSSPTFTGVVTLARKNFYISDEDKEAGKQPTEKRELYVLRSGRITPELIYANPTSLKAWRTFVKQCINQDQKFFTVLCEFSAERIKSQKTGFSWNKMKFSIVRVLDEDELAHVLEVRALVDARVKVYEDDDELAKVEEEAITEGRQRGGDPIDQHSKATTAELEEEDEEEEAPPAKAPKKSKPAPKEEAKAPKGGATKGGNGYPALDDDDDDDLPPAKSGKGNPAPDDDEDEDEDED
jgi:hypothetical protein